MEYFIDGEVDDLYLSCFVCLDSISLYVSVSQSKYDLNTWTTCSAYFCYLFSDTDRCLFFGDVSSKRDPSRYLKYIFAIYDYYRKDYHTCNKRENPPKTELTLIVNTPGWVKGKLTSLSVKFSENSLSPAFTSLLHINSCFHRIMIQWQFLYYCISGVAYDMLADMLKCIGPTHVVKINISAGNKNLPAGAFWLVGEHDGSVNLVEINSSCQDSFHRS